ncbi:DEAD/DEAH box helicase [Burkholderia vietnamiensis]|uniref:DEAD/DEAH box helicase n=1 Tax=Burkholderia vietnamiensis TaxID=60552 RepID=UPI001B9F5214|nr:DEAD/DEAH box helicase [Burkholderia vietnamiensis]MBR8356012.1 DEAD/DEAH box helicase [Burkholderia vietnamiensis]
MANFAARLSKRIQENPTFKSDYSWLCANGIAALTENRDLQLDVDQSEDETVRLTRLVESASCFAMDNDVRSHQLALTIALYGVASNREPALAAACGRILAELGNFPASSFVRKLHNIEEESLPRVVHVRDFARRYHNTVKLPSGSIPLTDFQFDIWQDLTEGLSTAVSAPTSAGKSFVVREYVVQKIKEMPTVRVAYIVPTRALMAEVQDKLALSLGHDDKTLRITSVPIEDIEMRPRQVFVVTQERLLSYMDEVPSACFDFVVVDEAQQMGDGSRGMILQECLERINKANPGCYQYFIAPMASRVDNLAAAVGRSQIATHLTQDSPVVSTKIVVRPSTDSIQDLILEMVDRGQRIPVGRLHREYGFGDRRTLLASVCIELGAAGGSLVYASGQADAEAIALQIAVDLPERGTAELIELARFIRSDVHRDYSLAYCVLRGVGFHYGSMPTLLRQALETAFHNGSLSYLVCTTTLFQGVNLPARNVFIDKVKRGRNDQLEEDDVWNFVGRAGRLMHDVAGNVFLVDYDNWPAKLLDAPPQVRVEPALSKILGPGLAQLEQYIEQRGAVEKGFQNLRDVEAAAGLMLNRVRKGTFRETISRCGGHLGEVEVTKLEQHLEGALAQLNVPSDVLDKNWLIAAWRLQAMYEFLDEKVVAGTWREYYPSHPMLPESYARYQNMFTAIEVHLNGKPNERWARYLNYQALAWMKGATISTMVDKELDHNPPKPRKNAAGVSSSNTAVRKIFDLLEKTLRFTYVQLTRAYCDCLAAALRKAGLTKEADSVYPVALALELGACTKTIISLIELGLSRISAQALSNVIKGSELTAPQIRNWLLSRSEGDLPISRIVLNELSRLRLLRTVS